MIWRLRMIGLTAAVFVVATMVVRVLQTSMREGSIKIFVDQGQRTNVSANLGSHVQGLQQISHTVAQVVEWDRR